MDMVAEMESVQKGGKAAHVALDRKKLVEFHGDACSLALLGARMGMTAIKYFDSKEHRRELIIIPENYACIVDGISFATGCTVGTGSIIPKDYGKHGVVFYHRKTDRAIRIRLSPVIGEEFVVGGREIIKDILDGGKFGKPSAHKSKFTKMFMELPDDKLFDIQPVEMVQSIRDPTPEQFLLQRGFIVDMVRCSSCNEYVEHTRAVVKGKKLLCIPCTGQAFYRSVSP